jgi:hypothetical protein
MLKKAMHQLLLEVSMSYMCPVCGYPGLKEQPRSEVTGPSDEICPSCGIQFGYDDEAGGNASARERIYQQWRKKWIAVGMPWKSKGIKPPHNWVTSDQLRAVHK